MNWSNYEDCLAAVKQDGFALQFVKKQTPEICLAAVKENGFALKFINIKQLETFYESNIEKRHWKTENGFAATQSYYRNE